MARSFRKSCLKHGRWIEIQYATGENTKRPCPDCPKPESRVATQPEESLGRHLYPDEYHLLNEGGKHGQTGP